MNKVILTGRLSKDPELATSNSGLSVAKFTLAVQRKYTNQDGEREADFLNCIVWRGQAENLAKYCHKGDKIGVVGSLVTRSYETPDGTKRYVTEVVAEEVEFINTKKNEAPAGEKQPELTPVEVEDDDFPF